MRGNFGRWAAVDDRSNAAFLSASGFLTPSTLYRVDADKVEVTPVKALPRPKDSIGTDWVASVADSGYAGGYATVGTNTGTSTVRAVVWTCVAG